MSQVFHHHRRRAPLLALLCLPVVLVFGGLMVKRLSVYHIRLQADFTQEWTSARNYWSGRPVYLPLNQSFRLYFGPRARTPLHVNAHPPTAVLLALPFGKLDYRAAWLTWNCLSLGLLGLSLWLLMRRAGLGYSILDAFPIVAILLASNPLAQQVIEGQMNLLLLALIVGAWSADRSERQTLAGTLIGCAAAVKLYPAFLVVYFLAARRWRAALATAVSFVALTLLTTAVLGPDIYTIYVRDVMPAFAHYGSNVANVSLGGLANAAFVGMRGLSTPLIAAPGAAIIARLVAGLLLAAFCGWKSWRATDVAGRDLAFAACMTGMLLASPITWGHSFVLLVAPLLIAWRHLPSPRVRGSLAVLIAALWLVRPGWVWNPLVPGFEAFSLGIAPASYRVPAVYAVTILSYLTYTLLAFFVLMIVAEPEPAGEVSLPLLMHDDRLVLGAAGGQ